MTFFKTISLLKNHTFQKKEKRLGDFTNQTVYGLVTILKLFKNFEVRMKRSFILSLIFGFLFLFMILESCSKEEFIDSGRTALDYAYECEAVLGPLPKFSCADAIEVPSTKNGVPRTSDSRRAENCDHPWAFGKPCQTGNKIGRYQGLNPDSTENQDVVFITFCRDGGLGVIGHKFSTGETCFFSIVDTGANPNDPPKPGDENYNEAWMTPSVVAADNCQNCHMASPFLHTPAVDQIKNPGNPSELLVPFTGNNPYSIIGAEFQQPHTTDIQNSCTSCHRPQCTQHFENYPLDELVMPAPFQNATDFDHSTISNTDREAIRNWCNSLGL